MHHWIFGYGSLIWRPDMTYQARRPARLHGWQRRFWQGSHDHRGLPHSPGRVVTLVAEQHTFCDGMAYQVEAGVAEETFEYLDHREKNGYERFEVELRFLDDEQGDEDAGARGLVYIAPVDNFAFLGPAPFEEMVSQIRQSSGPSGSNLEYALSLATALRELGAEDPHVFELEAALLERAVLEDDL